MGCSWQAGQNLHWSALLVSQSGANFQVGGKQSFFVLSITMDPVATGKRVLSVKLGSSRRLLAAKGAVYIGDEYRSRDGLYERSEYARVTEGNSSMREEQTQDGLHRYRRRMLMNPDRLLHIVQEIGSSTKLVTSDDMGAKLTNGDVIVHLSENVFKINHQILTPLDISFAYYNSVCPGENPFSLQLKIKGISYTLENGVQRSSPSSAFCEAFGVRPFAINGHVLEKTNIRVNAIRLMIQVLSIRAQQSKSFRNELRACFENCIVIAVGTNTFWFGVLRSEVIRGQKIDGNLEDLRGLNVMGWILYYMYMIHVVQAVTYVQNPISKYLPICSALYTGADMVENLLKCMNVKPGRTQAISRFRMFRTPVSLFSPHLLLEEYSDLGTQRQTPEEEDNNGSIPGPQDSDQSETPEAGGRRPFNDTDGSEVHEVLSPVTAPLQSQRAPEEEEEMDMTNVSSVSTHPYGDAEVLSPMNSTRLARADNDDEVIDLCDVSSCDEEEGGGDVTQIKVELDDVDRETVSKVVSDPSLNPRIRRVMNKLAGVSKREEGECADTDRPDIRTCSSVDPARQVVLQDARNFLTTPRARSVEPQIPLRGFVRGILQNSLSAATSTTTRSHPYKPEELSSTHHLSGTAQLLRSPPPPDIYSGTSLSSTDPYPSTSSRIGSSLFHQDFYLHQQHQFHHHDYRAQQQLYSTPGPVRPQTLHRYHQPKTYETSLFSIYHPPTTTTTTTASTAESTATSSSSTNISAHQQQQ